MKDNSGKTVGTEIFGAVDLKFKIKKNIFNNM